MKIPEPVKLLLRPIYVPILSWYYDTFKAPKRYHHLYDTIEAQKAKTILEIGVWNGKRAVDMIMTAKQFNADVTYYGFDLFEDLGEAGYHAELSKRPPTEVEVLTLLETTGAKIKLFKGNTLETLLQAVPSLPKIDFIFIDGGHSNETVANDWNAVKELMHERTVVIFDDYWRNRTDGGAKTTVDQIDRALFDVEILSEIDSFDNKDFGHLDISFAKVVMKKV